MKNIKNITFKNLLSILITPKSFEYVRKYPPPRTANKHKTINIPNIAHLILVKYFTTKNNDKNHNTININDNIQNI